MQEPCLDFECTFVFFLPRNPMFSDVKATAYHFLFPTLDLSTSDWIQKITGLTKTQFRWQFHSSEVPSLTNTVGFISGKDCYFFPKINDSTFTLVVLFAAFSVGKMYVMSYFLVYGRANVIEFCGAVVSFPFFIVFQQNDDYNFSGAGCDENL